MKRTTWLTMLSVLAIWSAAFGQTDLEKQVAACGQLSSCTITVPPGVNVVTAPWNLRDKASLTIRSAPGTQIIWFFAADPAPAVCMDTTGTRNIIIDGVKFALGNASKRPDVLWVHGRGANGRSQESLSVSNAAFVGWYTKVTVAFIAVENEMMVSVGFENSVPNTTSLFLSRDNEIGATSPFGPVRVNTATMTSTNHGYYNCAFSHEGHVGLIPPANNDLGFGITLGTGVHDLLIQGGSTSQGPRGGVMRILGTGNRRIAVLSPNWESESAKASIVVDGEVYGLTVRDGLLQANGPALRLNGTAANVSLCPAEMLTTSILQVDPGGKLTGNGLVAADFMGK